MLCNGRLCGPGEFGWPGRGLKRDIPWPSVSPSRQSEVEVV